MEALRQNGEQALSQYITEIPGLLRKRGIEGELSGIDAAVRGLQLHQIDAVLRFVRQYIVHLWPQIVLRLSVLLRLDHRHLFCQEHCVDVIVSAFEDPWYIRRQQRVQDDFRLDVGGEIVVDRPSFDLLHKVAGLLVHSMGSSLFSVSKLYQTSGRMASGHPLHGDRFRWIGMPLTLKAGWRSVWLLSCHPETAML